MKIVPILLVAAALPLCAQEIKMPANLDKLAAKAEETVDVTLDGAMLKIAAGFLGNKSGEADAKKFVAGLQSITVKSFEFRRDGEYDLADVEAIRVQLKAPQWARIVGVKQKDGENVDVYFKDGGNGNLGGVVVLAAEPRQLTIVSVVGTIDPTQLGGLSGQFGIPKLDLGINIETKGAKGAK